MITEISIKWCIDDVLALAKQRKIKFTKAQASEVLQLAERRHDACVGVNWDVLDCHIDEVIRDPRK